MTPINREILRAELERDEGLKLKAYKDTVGKWTIGVGRNLDDVGLRLHEMEKLNISLDSVKLKGITGEQAMYLLDSDIDGVMVDLDMHLPWWRTLDEVRQRVLCNMCFNLGINGLMGFKNTLKLISTKRYREAADNMLLSKWAGQVGKRANRLADLMRLGPIAA